MNNLTDQEILEVENRYWVELFQCLERLKENKDFQKLILEAYFKDRAINGTSLLAKGFPQGRDNRTDILEELVSISNLQYFFTMIENLGNPPADDEDEE